MTDTPVPVDPERLAGGRFSVYLDPAGRLVVAMAFDGEDTTHHWVVPRALLKLAGRQSGGDLIDMIRQLGAGGTGPG